MRDEQVLQPHGYATIPWDYSAIPGRMWKNSTELPNGCWQAPDHIAQYYRETAIERLLKRNAREMYAITATCGDRRCWNPAHTCVTVATHLSFKEG